MNKEFIPYEQALELKELGFKQYRTMANYDVKKNLVVFGVICNDDIPAPLYQQAFRWFREKYNLVNEINVYSTTDGYSFSFKVLCKKYTPFIDANDAWTTYEETELACLKKLIEIVKNK